MNTKRAYKVIGLMSGTSADGIDAALVEVGPGDPAGRLKLLAFDTYPYSDRIKKDILELCDHNSARVDMACRLNFILGELFAEAVCKITDKAGFDLEQIDLIGSHGQTIAHLPDEPFGASSTLQIGEAAVIAQRTGISTIADFRVADMAAGGQGAPLLPYLHYLIFKNTAKPVIVQNIGGIANLTLIPYPVCADKIIAFDTGPGNMLIDAVIGFTSGGRLSFDENGALAAKGKLLTGLFNELCANPYLKKIPPKTTGREQFGMALAQKIYRKSIAKDALSEDIIHTVTYFTAVSIANAYHDFILPAHNVEDVYIAGGGAYNNTLMSMLAGQIKPIRLHFMDELGFPADALEAIGFAVLAYENLRGRPANLPSVTGANRRVILGKVIILT